MKKQRLGRLAALALAAALAAAGACAEELPDSGEKAYELVIEVSGPAEVSVSHAARNPEADPVKDAERMPAGTLTLKEGPDYDVRLDGTGEGTVSYTVTLRDPAGKEEDKVLHRFGDIPVDGKTVLKTVANAKDQNTLLAYTREGEGGEEEELRAHTAYGSGKNSENITVNEQTVILAGVLLLVLIALPLLFRRRREVIVLQKPILQRKG